MSNMMELNKAAQARSDAASQAARHKCAMMLVWNEDDRAKAIEHAMAVDARRTAMYVERLMRNHDTQAFHDGICAIHGQWARACLEFAEKPNEYRYQSELGNI